MERSKKLSILAIVLLAACLVTVFALTREEKREEIAVSGEVVLSIPKDRVTAISWNQPESGETLSFTKDESWHYDGDEFFPVDGEKLEELLLSSFNDFSAGFVIENVEDYEQYGLQKPQCTIHIDTDSESYEIKLGNYSAMDSQRYVSIGDGNVYLAVSDPMEVFDIELKNLIKNDKIPDFGDFDKIAVGGEEKLSLIRDEEQSRSLRSGDIYYTELKGRELPLDNHNVEEFADKIRYLSLNNYASYNTSSEALADYGMDKPELSFRVSYTEKDQDGNEAPAEFTLSISRDPEELKERRESEEGYSTESLILEDPENIHAYARLNDSDIIYKISGEDYQRLMICRYNDLRDHHIVPADFENIVQIDFSLEGDKYSLVRSEDREKFTYLENEIDISDIEESLKTLAADEFTDEKPSQKQEISFTVYLDEELETKAEVSLYRYDGSSCLALIDGESFALTSREEVVKLIENLNSIVLDPELQTIPEE